MAPTRYASQSLDPVRWRVPCDQRRVGLPDSLVHQCIAYESLIFRRERVECRPPRRIAAERGEFSPLLESLHHLQRALKFVRNLVVTDQSIWHVRTLRSYVLTRHRSPQDVWCTNGYHAVF